jgi:hypothetical protein
VLGPSGHLYIAGFGRGDIIPVDAIAGAARDTAPGPAHAPSSGTPPSSRSRSRWCSAARSSSWSATTRRTRSSSTRRASRGARSGRSASHDAALGPDGLLHVAADSHPGPGSAIQVWDLDRGELVRHFGAPAEVDLAGGLAFGHAGELFVSDAFRDRVVELDAASGVAREWVGGAGERVGPTGIARGADGSLLVVDRVGVHRIDPISGDLEWTPIVADDGALGEPRSVAVLSPTALAAAARALAGQ